MKRQAGVAWLCFALLAIWSCAFAGVPARQRGVPARPIPNQVTGTVLDVTGRLAAVESDGDRTIRTIYFPGGVPPDVRPGVALHVQGRPHGRAVTDRAGYAILLRAIQ